MKHVYCFDDFLLNEEYVESEAKKKVFLFLGRFQPFHLGHLKVMKKLTKHFNCPGVISIIYSDKENVKSPFSKDILENEMSEVVKNEPNSVVDFIFENRGLLPVIIRDFQVRGYDVIGAGCGEDRYKEYQRHVDYMLGPKTDTYITPDFELVLVTRTDDNISATNVRNAIKEDDIETFKQNMPEYLYKFFDIFKKELKK